MADGYDFEILVQDGKFTTTSGEELTLENGKVNLEAGTLTGTLRKGSFVLNSVSIPLDMFRFQPVGETTLIGDEEY
jgi:hypothetical protein